MPNSVKKAAVDGVAVVSSQGSVRTQITILPISASGTGTLTALPAGGTAYEAVYDSAGNALTSIALSAQKTYLVEGFYSGFKLTSSNTADTFELFATSL